MQLAEDVTHEFENSGYDLTAIGRNIVQLLKQESVQLDFVLVCCRRMSELVNDFSIGRPLSPAAAKSDPQPMLEIVRQELGQRLDDIEIRRQELSHLIVRLSGKSVGGITLRQIATLFVPELQAELNQLRTEIKQKLLEIHEITTGNQLVLLYTLDFYQRFFQGFARDASPGESYNADGHVPANNNSHVIQLRC